MEIDFMASNSKKKNTADRTTAKSSGKELSQERQLSRQKLWLFRSIAAVGVPVIFILLVELCLRLGGFGYPTSFLLPITRDGRNLLVQNNQFGWRFFGPKLSRLPAPISVSPQKPPGTIRIFVLGESAAKGEPQPAFGFPRMLQILLRSRYPGTRFEVVNAAMTAINSHAILPIARDCANADGDIWVIYMGNNEVVGPFGAGTIFGRKVPPLPVIRTSLALETTRSGQLIESLFGAFRESSAQQNEWHGMEMFLGQQVRATDPNMRRVYQNFGRNRTSVCSTAVCGCCGILAAPFQAKLHWVTKGRKWRRP